MATNWEKLVSGNDLKKARALRSKNFITRKDWRVALPELEAQGWSYLKDYKDPKYIAVKKDKPYHEQFEDRVWMMLANMGFTTLNADNTFKMSYDFKNPGFTQQIDVFAADEETAIIVECKAAESVRDGEFKKKIEAFHGQMDGLRAEARKQFPKRKVKFIWAVSNYIMSPADVAKLDEWGIALFDDAAITYYSELVKHLGSAAKYQLLGNLFANQEIKNMDCRVPAIQGTMGKHTYYSFSIEPEKLLKIGYVLHHSKAHDSMMPAYQRIIKKKRLGEVREFIDKGGYFPNSIIISIDTNGRKLKFEPSATKVEGAISRLGVLYLPQQYRSAYIIDGQHRLYGYSDSKHASDNTIPVVAFVNLAKSEQVQLFMDINEHQKAVPKTLRVTLDADTLWISDDYNERRKALRSKLAQMLGEKISSPLYGRVVIGENEKSNVRCITIEALQDAMKKCRFLTTYVKKNIPENHGTFDTGDNEKTCTLLYPFLEECFRYIKNALPEEWEKGNADKGILTINRGVHGLLRVIDDIVVMLAKEGKIHPTTDKTKDMVLEVAYYLEPLVQFIKTISEDTRAEMRGKLGTGADTKYWRIFQKAIADKYPEFAPEGLNEWIQNEAKSYNDDAFQICDALQLYAKQIVAEKLYEKHGTKWFNAALPKKVVLRLQNEATEINYDNAEKGLELPDVEPWDCATLDDVQEVVTYGGNWQNTFKELLADPTQPKGDYKVRTAWMNKVCILGKKNRKTYSVSKADYDWLKELHAAIMPTE